MEVNLRVLRYLSKHECVAVGPADPPAGRPSVSCSGNTVTVTWCSAPYDGGCMVTGYCVEMKRTQDTEWQIVTDR